MIIIEEPIAEGASWHDHHGRDFTEHRRGSRHRHRGYRHVRSRTPTRVRQGLRALTHTLWAVAFVGFSVGIAAWAVRFAADQV